MSPTIFLAAPAFTSSWAPWSSRASSKSSSRNRSNGRQASSSLRKERAISRPFIGRLWLIDGGSLCEILPCRSWSMRRCRFGLRTPRRLRLRAPSCSSCPSSARRSARPRGSGAERGWRPRRTPMPKPWAPSPPRELAAAFFEGFVIRGPRHRLEPHGVLQLRLGQQSFFQHDLGDRAPLVERPAGDARAGLVAEHRRQRGDEADASSRRGRGSARDRPRCRRRSGVVSVSIAAVSIRSEVRTQ